jgi:6-phosphofructokinase 1
MKSIRTIGVLTSGGDAPGMNAAIRAVVRTALFNNINPLGILRGYEGLVEKEFVPLTSQSVTNIIQKGGTILKTARSESFRTAEGMEKAYNNLKDNAIDALVVIRIWQKIRFPCNRPSGHY